MPSPDDNEDDEVREDDEAVWRHVAATVRPLPGRLRPIAPARPPVTLPRSASQRQTSLSLAAPMASDLDGRTAERLSRGLLPIDGRLDLHGLTQDAAHRRLLDFVRRGHAGGRRCLLVITGKGEAQGEGPWYAPAKGVLRASLAGWLAAPDVAPLILRLQPAQRRHGGDGAFYVLLRRRRE